MKNINALASLILCTSLASGCSGILTSDQPARQYYLLKPLETAPRASTDAERPVLRLSVGAVPGLDTDRILALGPDARLQRYANACWPDHLPEVLTSVMARSMAATGRFSVHERFESGSDDAWALAIEARQFYGLRSAAEGTSAVQVELVGQIECGGSRHEVGAVESVPVGVEHLADIVAAHQAGLDRVTRDLIAQIEQHCAD
ncbi:MAG: ABC-type transport auxiliary lipoprotein family protein [Xanthomonadales bacterium]|nr:ABC-type transport auxiliary lipoprotein family protein [Xanthomonadales bacterium]